MYRDFSMEINGDVGVINVNLTRATIKEVKEFKEHIEDLRASKIKKIVINLLEPLFVDSSIIGAMVLTSKDLRTQGGDLVVVTSPEGINNMFAAAGLSRVFNIYNNVNDAVYSIRQS